MLITVNLRMMFVLNLPLLNMQLVYKFRIPHIQWIVGVILLMLGVPCLLEKGGGIHGLMPLRERGRDISPR